MNLSINASNENKCNYGYDLILINRWKHIYLDGWETSEQCVCEKHIQIWLSFNAHKEWREIEGETSKEIPS